MVLRGLMEFTRVIVSAKSSSHRDENISTVTDVVESHDDKISPTTVSNIE